MGRYQDLASNPKYARLAGQEELIQKMTYEILCWMEEKGVDRAVLARRLERSRSYVTQLFNGKRNITLRTLADICWALDVKLQIKRKPELGEIYRSHDESAKFNIEQEVVSQSDYETGRFFSNQPFSLKRIFCVTHSGIPRKCEVETIDARQSEVA